MNQEEKLDLLGEWIFNGEEEKVRAILNSGINLNQANAKDMNFLMVAIEGDQPKILELLLKSGANPNEKALGTTALHWAVDYAVDGMIQNNRTTPYPEPLECIKILLRYGADKNIQDNQGKTPLDYPITPEIKDLFEKENS